MEPFIGEIRIFGGDYAPVGWMLCEGQLLTIRESSALFSIVGNTYGGDGRTNFALPDLTGRAALSQGAGPGLTTKKCGDNGGMPVVNLTVASMPAHTHPPTYNSTASRNTPDGSVWANTAPRDGVPVYKVSSNNNMNAQAIESVGASTPHNNAQPYLCLKFIIAVQGIYPVQS